MKKIFTISTVLLLSLSWTMNALAQNATVVTSATTASTPLTLAGLKSMAGQKGHIAFVNVGSGKWQNKWLELPSNQNATNVSTASLFKLVEGNTEGTYHIQNFNGLYRGASSWVNESSAVDITFTGLSSGQAKAYGTIDCNQPVKIYNSSNALWNINYASDNGGSFGGGDNSWAYYAAIGPLYYVTIQYQDSEGTTLRNSVTQIMTAGTVTAPAIDGYDLPETASYTLEDDATITFVYTKKSDYKEAVTSDIKPYFDNAGTYFSLTTSAADRMQSTLDAALVTCDEATYNELLAFVQNRENLRFPETGYYRLKNKVTEHYMAYGRANNYNGLIAKSDPDATDPSTIIRLTGSNGTYTLSTQGLNVQSQTTGNRVFPATSETGVSLTFTPISCGYTTIQDANSYTDAYYAGFLIESSTDGWAVRGVINWQSEVEDAQWSLEDATSLTTSLAAIEEASYSTLYVDFPVATTDASTAIYTLNAEQEDGQYVVSKVGSVPAQTGILLRNISCASTVTLSIPSTPTVETSALSGSLVATTAGEGCYILSNGSDGLGFYPYANGSALAANKAFLETSSGIRSLSLNFDESNVNGIQNIESSSSTYTFDMQGRRVLNAQKGIYIVNGKKIIIK